MDQWMDKPSYRDAKATSKKEEAPKPPITIIQTNHIRERGMTFHQIGNDSKIAHKNKYFHLNLKQANSQKTLDSSLMTEKIF